MQGRISQVWVLEDSPDDEALTRRAFGKTAFPPELTFWRDGLQPVEAASHLELPLPDLVLLDLKLPKLTGIEVIEHLRQLPRWKVIPLVMLTSSDEPVDIVRAYQAGANGYIRKPVPYPDYLEVIRVISEFWLRINISPVRATEKL